MKIMDKIKSPDEVAEIVKKEQADGKTAVFTNGCFDLIHVGHTRYLKQARGYGDVLIVALNTDESVVKLKGPKRPLLPLSERLRIIASFSMVDYVTWFNELDPWEVINTIRPKILVKGGNYKIDEIIGRDIIWSIGGRVIPAPLFKGISTSTIIERVVHRFANKPLLRKREPNNGTTKKDT